MSFKHKLDERLDLNKDKCSKLFIKALTENLSDEKLFGEFEKADNFETVMFNPKKYLSFKDRFEFFQNKCRKEQYCDQKKVEKKVLEYWEPKGIYNIKIYFRCYNVVFKNGVFDPKYK
tara:strand:- start:1806 stop:2159 length:354 start_codon:yes stop_codon:yes gene_type:complete